LDDAGMAGTRILLIEQVCGSGWSRYGMAATGGKSGGDTGRNNHQVNLASAIFAHPIPVDNFVDVCFADVQVQPIGMHCEAVMVRECCNSSAAGHLWIGCQAVKDARVRPQATNLPSR
jgi:hypothetical protein